jgi:hypothetical protein
LILSFWNDSIFYLFLDPFPHLVAWVEPEGEWERGRGERGRGGELLEENLNQKSKI